MATGEAAYIFRHAVVRDAAYQLMPPGDRALLHHEALLHLEATHGGRPPELPPIDPAVNARAPAHSTDAIAHELAWHAAESGGNQAAYRNYLRRAAEYAGRQYRAHDSARLWHALAEACTGTERTEATRRAGVEYLNSLSTETGVSLLQQALSEFRASGNPMGEGAVLANLAVHHFHIGDARVAEQMNTNALEILANGQNKRALATAMGNQATFFMQTSRFAQAEQMLHDVLALFSEIGESSMHATALGNLGVLYQWTNRLEPAENAFKQALAGHRASGNIASAGNALGNLGILYRDLGQPDTAEEMYRLALQDLRRAGDLRYEGVVLGNLASLLADQARWSEAEAAGRQALELHAQLGSAAYESLALLNLANVYARTGRPREALDAAEKALPISRRLGDAADEGRLQTLKAMALLELGERAQAQECWRLAKARLHDSGQVLQKAADDVRRVCERLGVDPLD